MLSPRVTATGSGGSALSNFIGPLESGALCFVSEENALYYFNATSTATVAAPNVIPTGRGSSVPGRWFKYVPPPETTRVTFEVPGLSDPEFATVTLAVPGARPGDTFAISVNPISDGVPPVLFGDARCEVNDEVILPMVAVSSTSPVQCLAVVSRFAVGG